MPEFITSRKNKIIQHFRRLAKESAYRRGQGLYLCDGEKFLREAIAGGAEIDQVIWRGREKNVPELTAHQYVVPSELFDYISPLQNSQGPLFSVQMHMPMQRTLRHVLVLENVQDPGNVGTVIRTANAFGMDAVILCGACADLYNPKTVRATMGSIFRQYVQELAMEDIPALLRANHLKLFGAALTESARDIRTLSLSGLAIAIGSEGRGLSKELLSLCDGQLIIPMCAASESLNAAVAASVCMWEMTK